MAVTGEGPAARRWGDDTDVRRPVWIGLVTALSASLFVVACQLTPRTGITREQAIELALHGGIPLEKPVVTLAREGRLRDLRVGAMGEPGPGQDMNQLVWQVTLEGIRTVCPPAPGGNCQRFKATTQVYLDLTTGTFLFSETGGNPGLPVP